MRSRWTLPLAPCALLATSLVARAETPVRLKTEGALPFTAEELELATGARLVMSAESDAAAVTVEPGAAGSVEVHTGAQRAVVPLGGRTGLAAARVVAIAIAELMAALPTPTPPANTAPRPSPSPSPPPSSSPSPSPPPSSPSPSPAGEAPASANESPAVSSRPVGTSAAPVAPPPSAPVLPVRIAVAFGAVKGTQGEEPLSWSLAAEAAFPLPGVDLVASAGLWESPTTHAGRIDEASFVAGMFRAGAGWRMGPVQVGLGPFVAPYRIEGAIRHSGALYGAGTIVRGGPSLGPRQRVHVFAWLGADVFLNRVRVSWSGATPSFASPRMAGAAGLGVGWDLGG